MDYIDPASMMNDSQYIDQSITNFENLNVPEPIFHETNEEIETSYETSETSALLKKRIINKDANLA
jgi:hypothetical protein